MTTLRVETGRRMHRRVAAVVAGLALLASACSADDGSDAGGGTPTSTTVATSAGRAGRASERTCDQGATVDRVQVEKDTDPAFPDDYTITSFDGAEIRTHWFPVAGASAREPAPTVLMGPGWSLAGDTSLDGAPLFASLSIRALHDAGYNVLTWDPRGFGRSTGTVEVNSPETEGRDVQLLFDWVAEQPEAVTDGKGDPRVGMVGFSYGGGIQLVVASIDCRVDALVPGIAWHSLETALYRNETVKLGWATTLRAAAGGAQVDPHLDSALEDARGTGVISEEDIGWFRDRGPGADIDKVEVPTLFLQGTVDTLFAPGEALTNYRSLRERGVPTAMVWFCGGHGVCLTDPGDVDRTTEASFAWLDRYLMGDGTAATVPTSTTCPPEKPIDCPTSAFEAVDQDGTSWSADFYPDTIEETLTATGEGTLALTEASVAGPAEVPATNTDVLGGLVAPITPAPATEALELTLDVDEVDGLILGSPTLSLTYTGEAPAGDTPTRAFAQLVDDETGLLVGNQITPVPLELDGDEHQVSVDMEAVAHHVEPGHSLTLQLVATTLAYATPRLGGEVTFDRINLELPLVTKGFTRR